MKNVFVILVRKTAIYAPVVLTHMAGKMLFTVRQPPFIEFQHPIAFHNMPRAISSSVH
jgi:hypothetical protein